MATFIISGSRGTDDPTMATLPFMAAKTAKEQGHDVVLWLWNEAVTSARKGCAVARQIGGSDLVAGAFIKGMPDYIKAVAERDRSVAF